MRARANVLVSRPPAARPGDKRRDHGGDTLRQALAQCNELLMNLDHVIADDDVRADIDKINKVRRTEHVSAAHETDSPFLLPWRECLAVTIDLGGYGCVWLVRRAGSREVEKGCAEAWCVTRSSCVLAEAYTLSNAVECRVPRVAHRGQQEKTVASIFPDEQSECVPFH